MPFIINWNHLGRLTTPDQAKLQIAKVWRQNMRNRNIDSVDKFTTLSAERLYNIQQGDIWVGNIIEWIAP